MPAFLLPLLLRFAAPLLGIAAVLLMAWGVTLHYEHKGRDKAEAIYKPKLAACETVKTSALENVKGLQSDLDALVLANREREVALEGMLDEERKAQSRAKVELARLAGKEMSLRAEIGRLAAISKGPPAQTKEVACDGAEQILRDLATRRAR